MSFKLKLLFLFITLAVVPLAIAGFVSYQQAKKELVKGTIEKLVAVADVQEKRVNEVLDRNIEIAKLVGSRIEFPVGLKAYIRTGDGNELAGIKRMMHEVKISLSTIRRITIIDQNEIIVTSTDEALAGKPVRSLWRKEHPAETKFYHFHEIFKDDSNQLRVRLHGPLFLEDEQIGLFEIEMPADPFVAVTEDYAGLGETGEVLLAEKNQTGDALYITPLRFDAGAALTRAVSKNRTDMAITRAILGEEKDIKGDKSVDYRDEPIFAVTRFIDSLGWGLVVKIDQAEALSPAKTLLTTFFTIIILGVLVAIALAYLFSRLLTRPIIELTHVALKLQSGDFSVQASGQSKDEIGMLGQTFNSMAGKLRQSYATLERKIRDRTHDLYKRTAELEKAQTATLNILEDLNNERDTLTQMKAKDEALLAHIADGVIAVNEQGNIILMNHAAETMLGWKSREALGKHWFTILKRQDEKGNPVSPEEGAIHAALASTTTTTTTAYYYVRKDGTKFPVARTVSPVTLAGNVIGAINVFRDITREKEIDTMKSEFVSLASHQLRTPMTGIQWVTERILKKEKLSESGREYMMDIHTSVQKLAALVDLLLNVTRIESGRVSVSPQPLELIGFMSSYLSENTPLCKKKHITLTFKDHPTELMVMSDTSALRNVVQSLVSNALEYTPEGGTVEVVVEVPEGRFKDKRFIITVRDTGIGIPLEEQKTIFTKFKRAHNAGRVKTDGTGLGLYIANEATKLLGGKIWFESKGEGMGTTFFVELPIESKLKEGDKKLS